MIHLRRPLRAAFQLLRQPALATGHICTVAALLGLLLVAANRQAGADEPQLRKVLTSAKENVHVDKWREEGNTTAADSHWTVEKKTLHGGKQEGVDLIVVNNGKLALTVIPTRGMSVLQVVAGDVRLGWRSPVKEVVNPQFINLQSRGGLGWLDGFNEWMVRCGLEFAGHPGTDKFINNVGAEAEMELTLHGKIGNIPASEVEVVVDRQSPHRIRVRGRVDERSFYGPKLELWTEISTVPGAMDFRIDDTVTNRGDAPQEFQVIYHVNHGPPLLEKGARFVAPIRRITPFNDRAAEGIDHYDTYAAPTPGFVEQLYCIEAYGDADGRTLVMLENAAADRGVSLSYSLAQLPYLTQWKNTLTKGDGYVTGIEPGTGYPHNRRIERKAGRVPKLSAGESRRFTIDFAIHRGAADVRQVAKRIDAIRAGRETKVDRQPVRVE